jgi:hypothetical protein
MENGPCIDDLPMKIVIFHSFLYIFVCLPEGITLRQHKKSMVGFASSFLVLEGGLFYIRL